MTDSKDPVYRVLWAEDLEEVDREIARLAILCQVQDPRARRDAASAAKGRLGVRNAESRGVSPSCTTCSCCTWRYARNRPTRSGRRRPRRSRTTSSSGCASPSRTWRDAGRPRSKGKRMDVTLVSAMSGVLGSLVGGSASVATTWMAQKTLSRRELLARRDAQARGALRRIHRRMREAPDGRAGHIAGEARDAAAGLRAAQPHPPVRLAAVLGGGRERC